MQLCSNTQSLNNYIYQQDKLDEEWIMTKHIKRDACVELARKILLQDVDRYTFEVAFAENYINVSEDKYEWLLATLDDIDLGICDPILKRAFIIEALDAAAFCLYDCELSELLDDRLQHNEQLEVLINEVNL